MTRVLVIEDNRNLATGLRNNLEIEGYEVLAAADGQAGLSLARSSSPDLIILDLMLPGVDGYRVLATLREEGIDTPVLILSARGEEADKVLGFRLGADDYVAKPFGLLELLARVDALLRRASAAGSAAKLAAPVSFGDVYVDPRTHTVQRAGSAVALRPKEYDLLIALLQRRGRSRRGQNCSRRCGATRARSIAARSTRTSPSFGASSRMIHRSRATFSRCGKQDIDSSPDPP